MFCDKCGTENPDDGAFCQKCGASLTATPKKKGAKAKASAPAESNVSRSVNIQLPIPEMLFYGAITVLLLGLLYGILLAAGLPDGYSGTYKFAEFLKGLIYGVVGGGVLFGLHALITRK